MSRVLQLIGLLVLLPYAYVGWYWLDFWLFAETTRFEARMLLAGFVLLMALPFLIGFFALVSALTGARALKDDVAARKPVRAFSRAGFVWLAVIVAVPALFTSY